MFLTSLLSPLGFLKYWRAILAVIVVGGAMGYLWHQSHKIDTLSLQNIQLQHTLEGSQKAMKALVDARAADAIALKEKSAREAKISSQTYKQRQEIKLLQEKANEKAKECNATAIDPAVNERLRNLSRQ